MVCLHSQVLTFHLWVLHRLLYSASIHTAWNQLGHAFLLHLQGLRYSWQLFYLCRLGLAQSMGELSVFYQDLLRAWGLLSTSRSPLWVAQGDNLLAKLLLCNPQVVAPAAALPWACQRMAWVGLT